ncbi:hypothetical protein F7734_20970 [Scytonema sp. UIC 10036]|uniref:hypothetical protein n=1 Tax=Scytonema sp. UIC 10036 TaxID=2304196 RepID=UPI0012DAC884|nr:hypothetical protein [Scytonema sp. UIC 10036]MUG94700.1 hypothetical protein [Scytonema sp. UIC 10036]
MNATCSPIWNSLIALWLLTVATVFPQPATAETITGQSGNVRAEISYEKAQDYQYKNVRLKIIRAGSRYPKIIKNHASELWQFYLKEGKQYEDGKGVLAAYLADKYMLGQGEDGWMQVRQAYKGRDRNSYFADLRKFLRETGYIR